MDDGGTGLKKFKIDPFLTGSAVGLFIVVDSGAFFTSSVTFFSGAVSVPLDAGSEAVTSVDTRLFLVFGSFGESSRILRLPYVRNGLTRDRGTDGAGLAHLIGSVYLHRHEKTERNRTFWGFALQLIVMLSDINPGPCCCRVVMHVN